MAKSNDMPEFHSVKVSLTENIPTVATRLPAAAYTRSYMLLSAKGGCCHV